MATIFGALAARERTRRSVLTTCAHFVSSMLIAVVLVATPQVVEAQALTFTGTVTNVRPKPTTPSAASGIRIGDTFSFTFEIPPTVCLDQPVINGCSSNIYGL